MIDKEIYEQLLQEGIDYFLVQYVVYFFIRDLLILFEEKIYLDDVNEFDYFENIQFINWQIMRFKFFFLNLDIGWRVEF